MTHSRILVLNQYYAPAFESTAQLLTQLCEGVADDADVMVITGTTEEPSPARERRNGVEVVRVYSTGFERRRVWMRALNYLSYTISLLRTALSVQRPNLVVCMSDPPFVSVLAWIVARRHRVRCVAIVQDVFPEIAVELGRMENGLLVRVLDMLVSQGLKRADRVVAIGETMRERLVTKGIRAERIVVIPNWVDASELVPTDKDNEWARDHGLDHEFVVMHSGNVGYAQDLDVLVQASTFLRDLSNIRFVVIGSGARQADLVRLCDRLDADRFTFLPYQPREVLPLSLSTADLHFVGLGRGLAGYVVPSRLNGVLSVGRPVLVAADSESEIVELVQEAACGITLPPGRADLVAAVIRDAHDGRYDLAEMGRRGREYVVSKLDRPISVGMYRQLFAALLV